LLCYNIIIFWYSKIDILGILDMKNGINFNLYEHELIYRSLVLTPDERFGLGLMFKAGNRLEYDNEIHTRFVLVIVLRGEGTLYDETGEKFNLKAGMSFKRIPGRAETLSIKDDRKWVEFFIEIGPALYQALRSMRIIETNPLCENIEIDVDFFASSSVCAVNQSSLTLEISGS